MTKILIIDDHPLVRRGLKELIEQEEDLVICAEADGAAAALRFREQTRPDLAIVDIALADSDGLDLIKRLRALDASLKIIVCSMYADRIYVSRALRAGAMGYVNKNEPAERLIEAIRRVLKGKVYLGPEMSDDLIQILLAGGRGGDRPGSTSPAQLSDRELGVLRLIGDGLTSRQIAKQLGLSIKTVDTHREHIKAKLKLRNASELIRYAVTWNLKET